MIQTKTSSNSPAFNEKKFDEPHFKENVEKLTPQGAKPTTTMVGQKNQHNNSTCTFATAPTKMEEKERGWVRREIIQYDSENWQAKGDRRGQSRKLRSKG